MAGPEGAERTDELTVEGRLLTDVGGTIPVTVLSTPGMIGMMERRSAMLALEHLPDGEATVGVEVREGDRVLGVGTDARRVAMRA